MMPDLQAYVVGGALLHRVWTSTCMCSTNHLSKGTPLRHRWSNAHPRAAPASPNRSTWQMALKDYFTRADHDGGTCVWSLHSLVEVEVPAEHVQALAAELAELFVRDRCSPRAARLWLEVRDTRHVLEPHERKLLNAYIEPTFGLPTEGDEEAPEEIPQHVQGGIAEQLWYYLQREYQAEESIVYLHKPDLGSTKQGGDSLAIHRYDDGLAFRLWELKKCDARRLQPTLDKAYTQLTAKGARYLAQLALPNEFVLDARDAELAEFFGQLPELWVDANPRAGAGVSVAIPDRLIPAGCFDDFPGRFPDFRDPRQLRGALTALGDFRSFVLQVREEVWKGL